MTETASPKTASSQGFVLRLEAPQSAAGAIETLLEPIEGVFSAGVPNEAGDVEMALYLQEAPEETAVQAQLSLASEVLALPPIPYVLEPLPDIDWVAASQRDLAPIRAGRFFIHGSHDKPPTGGSTMPLLIDAGAAFGTGRHETTWGCLMVLQRLAKAWRPDRVLDMGCGSGVLAMAAARLWPVEVLGIDNDPVAVEVARNNAGLNNFNRRLKYACGDGYQAETLVKDPGFDLILANILAEPLIAMAASLSRQLNAGGQAILAGLLTSQARKVLYRHQAQGLRLVERMEVGDWTILRLHKPG